MLPEKWCIKNWTIGDKNSNKELKDFLEKHEIRIGSWSFDSPSYYHFLGDKDYDCSREMKTGFSLLSFEELKQILEGNLEQEPLIYF